MTAHRVGARRPLRIGIFIALLPPEHHGGAELQADRLARELAARGHAVHVFARRQPGRAASEERAGVRVHRRTVVPVPGLRLAAEVALGAVQAAREKPDVLLCYMTMNSGLLGATASLLCGAPFVVWQRLEAESLRESGAERRLAFWILRRTAGLWVQAAMFSRILREEFERTNRARDWVRLEPRLRILGNGIDLPDDPPAIAPAPAPRFLFVGRLVDQKDLPTLVEAARRVGGGAEVWLAGEGALRGALEAQAAGAPVRFLGEVPHARVPQLLRDCRALVLCSNREGVPNAVLEALAYDRPVVATPVGAVPELVRDGVNGRLVPVGDPERLAAALRDLLDDATWRALAQGARPSVEKFSWPRLVEQVETELAALAAGGDGAWGGT